MCTCVITMVLSIYNELKLIYYLRKNLALKVNEV